MNNYYTQIEKVAHAPVEYATIIKVADTGARRIKDALEDMQYGRDLKPEIYDPTGELKSRFLDTNSSEYSPASWNIAMAVSRGQRALKLTHKLDLDNEDLNHHMHRMHNVMDSKTVADYISELRNADPISDYEIHRQMENAQNLDEIASSDHPAAPFFGYAKGLVPDTYTSFYDND